MAFLKQVSKIKRIISEKILGNAIVVTPELVPNREWDWKNGDSVDSAMAVSSETFYNYLGHYISPNEALTIGPFQNDITKSIDNVEVGSPGIFPFNELTVDTEEKFFKYVGSSRITSSNINNANTAIEFDVDGPSSLFPRTSAYGGYMNVSDYYLWDGIWGNLNGQFQTGVEFDVIINVTNDKGRAGVDGVPNNTDADMKFWIGDIFDAEFGTARKFYNPHFSTGKIFYGNGTSKTDRFSITIKRKPGETGLLYHVSGRFKGNERGQITGPSFGFSLPGGQFINGLVSALTSVIQALFNVLLNFIFVVIGQTYTERYNSTISIELVERRKYYSSFQEPDYEKHPANTLFVGSGTSFPLLSYMFTQFHYPYFDLNRFKVYGKEYYSNIPYMQNELVTGNSYTASRELKKYRYFVPNLFRILFETNIGVFYEFLLRQSNVQLSISSAADYNFNTKILPEDNKATEDDSVRITSQKKTIYDVILPTDEIYFNNIIENGLQTQSCYDTVSFVYNIISTTDINLINSYNHQFSGISSEYDDVYSKYALGTKIGAGSTGGAVTTRIQEINDIIGDFSTIKTILESSDGYSLENWTTRCNDPAQHVGLEDLTDLSSFGLANGIATYSGSASDWNYEKYEFDPASPTVTGIPAYYSDLINGGKIYEVYYNPAHPTSPAYWSSWTNQANVPLDQNDASDADLILFLNDIKTSTPAINTGFLFFLVEDDFVGDGGRSSMLCVAIENFQWDQVDIETKLTNLGYTNTVLVSNVKNSIYDIKKISGGVDNIVTDVGFDVSILPNNYAILTLGGLGGLASVASLRNQDPSRTYVYDNHTDRYSNFGVNATNKFTDAYVIQPMSSVGTTSSSLSLGELSQIENAYMVIDGIRYEFIAGSWQAQSTGGSASPKNLSYKIIQFILWYMQPNGIADQSRLTTRSLFEYEKLIDQDIDNFDTDTYNQVEADPTKSNNPIIIGDTIYERKC